ncbi:MAG: hypothetical protein L6Q84_07520 [Polyangiaceae bacterium]|nr:hypothetical protein [Polyangiaceae bacterium]
MRRYSTECLFVALVVTSGCGGSVSESAAGGGGNTGGSPTGGGTAGTGSGNSSGGGTTGTNAGGAGGSGSGGTGSSGGKAGCPNQPAGAAVLLDTPFNTSDGEGQLWEVYPGAGKIVQPPGSPAPASAPKASASILAAGQSSGGQQTIWPKPGSEKALSNLYMCMNWKMNSDFVGLQSGNKLVFLASQHFTFGKQKANGFLAVSKRAAEYPDKHFRMLFAHNTSALDNPQSCASDFGFACHPNVSDTDLVPDTWYTVEALVIASTCPTCKNATVKWWIDGVLQGSYTNLNYGEGIVNEWQINHNWDGGIDETECGPPTNPGNPKGRDCTKDQIHYFDHVVLGSVL